MQSLWIGQLTTMQRMCMRSFLQHGHEYHLYVYDDVGNVPAGVKVIDGREILPESRIIRYQAEPWKGGVALFADIFQWNLLFQRGGWWVDTDMYCLKPFRFDSEWVISSVESEGANVPNVGAFTLPRESVPLEYAVNACEVRGHGDVHWGELGPRLMQELVEIYNLEKAVQPGATFCPIPWEDWRSMLDPKAKFDFSQSLAVHLSNEMWRQEGVSPDRMFDPDCLYENFKRRSASVSDGFVHTGPRR